MTIERLAVGRTSERGVTIVESAIILTMFFALLFGIIEAGRFLNMRQVLTNAAREGARFAVAPTSGTNNLPAEAEIQAKVDSFLAAAHITGATVATKCPTTAPETCTTKDTSMSVTTGIVTTTYTEVTVTKPFSVVTVPGFFNALQINLTGKAMMRRETSD
jgi:Flp pilus assembly protein TadG